MHPLEQKANQTTAMRDDRNFDEKLDDYSFNQSKKGVVPYLTNAVNSMNRGLTQVIETPYNIVNRAPQLVNLLPGEQGVEPLFDDPDPLINFMGKNYPAMDEVGGINKPNPNYPRTSMFMEDVGLGIGSMGGTALAAKFAPGVAGKFAQYLNTPVQAAPKTAVASEVAAAGGAATGREIADQNDLGPIGSFMAEFLGSLGPGALAYSGPAAISKVFTREGGQESLEAMQRQGIRPSVGLTGNRAGAQLESGASALPFFSAIPENVRGQQFDEFSDALTGAADNIRPAGTGPLVKPAEMGEQVYDIADSGVKRLKEGFGVREDALMKIIGPDSPVDTTSVRAAIADEMTRGDAKIKRALQAELDDLDVIADEAGKVPYESLRKWRSNFGSNIDDKGVLSGSKKQVYAGVTKDTEALADAAGQGDEFRSLMSDQAKSYDKTARLSEGGDIPQFKKLSEGQIEKSSTFLKQAYKNPDKMELLKRNATPEQWDQLRANVAQDLGLARAGAQDATGDIISPTKFITEWNKMDPRVKNMLFDDDLGTRQTLDDLALIAADFERRGLEANTSRTAGTGLSAMGIKEGAAGIAGGYAGAQNLPATLAAAGITYASIKGLMSETLAKWAGGQSPSITGTIGARVPGAAARAGTDENEPLRFTVKPSDKE